MKHKSYKKTDIESYDQFATRVFRDCLKHMSPREATGAANLIAGEAKEFCIRQRDARGLANKDEIDEGYKGDRD